jgi:hypothetical protein
MNAEELQDLNPRHQPETVSTAILQSLVDPEGGLPLESAEVKAREQQCFGRPPTIKPPQSDAGHNTEIEPRN